jgi:hypothetical protein
MGFENAGLNLRKVGERSGQRSSAAPYSIRTAAPIAASWSCGPVKPSIPWSRSARSACVSRCAAL